MNITGAGKVAGVMGWPIAHSLSPVLHGYWLREKKVDGALVPLGVRPEDFSTVLMALRKAGFTGVNVTVPHKEAAFALADSCDAPASAAGAVNLLVFHGDGRIEGRNTDAVGLCESLREALGETLRGKTALLLGAGGGARGAVLALAQHGVTTIHILNRHADRAKSLCDALAPMVKSRLLPGGFADWDKAAGGAALLVNATSAGMNDRNFLTLPLEPLPRDAAVCDIVYNPLETDLLRRARARGHVCLDGLGMLMHQAAPSFEAFFGVKPEVTEGLRAVLERVLTHGQSAHG
jgi:shikimate dehydrogenase